MTENPQGPGPGFGTNSGAVVVLGSFRNYREAEEAVDRLSDNGFPVERSAIVGRGLTSYEQITGRLTTWRAAGQSALSGVVLGALFGWVFGLFDWVNPLVSGLVLALYGAVFGLVVGALIGLIGHALTGGRRDFSSVTNVRAERYELIVDADRAQQAEQLLRRGAA